MNELIYDITDLEPVSACCGADIILHDICDDWNHPYSKESAVFPTQWNKENKFWPYVSRIDNAFGDRNFFCVCPDINSYK